MYTDLVGLIYEDSMVLGLTKPADRYKWYDIISNKGVEEADAYLFSKQFDKVPLQGEEDPLPWSTWMISGKKGTNYVLVPWTSNPECHLLENEAMKPQKVLYGTRGFSGLDRHIMFVLSGYKIEIPVEELEKYNIYMTAMKFLIGTPEEVCAGI